jgi:hypothetical protein
MDVVWDVGALVPSSVPGSKARVDCRTPPDGSVGRGKNTSPGPVSQAPGASRSGSPRLVCRPRQLVALNGYAHTSGMSRVVSFRNGVRKCLILNRHVPCWCCAFTPEIGGRRRAIRAKAPRMGGRRAIGRLGGITFPPLRRGLVSCCGREVRLTRPHGEVHLPSQSHGGSRRNGSVPDAQHESYRSQSNVSSSRESATMQIRVQRCSRRRRHGRRHPAEIRALNHTPTG